MLAVTADPLAPLLDLPGVADAVTASRESVDRLLGHRVLRRRSAEVSGESLLRGAWASATLAGASATLAEVRAAAPDPVVQGALRISADLSVLAETFRTAPRQVLARLHVLAGAGLLPAAELGRPRPGPEVAGRLETLFEVLELTSSPALVVAAIVHGELLALDAFAPVTGLVARGAARLVLIDRGLDPRSLVPFEVGHLELASEYEQALADYRAGTPEGVAGWIQHCGRGLALGVRESVAMCEALQRG